MQVDHFVKHHFSAKCLPRFAIAFPIGVFICTDEPSIQKHHRAQEQFSVPSIHRKMNLSFPSLFLAFYCSISWKFRSFIENYFPPPPKFLQYIAGLHFWDSEEPFFFAVYTLPSSRTAVFRHTRFLFIDFGSDVPPYRCFSLFLPTLCVSYFLVIYDDYQALNFHFRRFLFQPLPMCR